MKQVETIICPVEVTLSIVGGKWKPIIVWYLLSSTKRFGQLRRLTPGATQQMLTQQLRELRQAEVLHRQIYTQVPPEGGIFADSPGTKLRAGDLPVGRVGRVILCPNE
ncbi:hypothetical protein KSC_035010 [Ktedonobacter sp. SOSP1-52]|nr:hypothetical protein KSC_035010 [Ktedonobacter sp. SOSP1-52]